MGISSFAALTGQGQGQRQVQGQGRKLPQRMGRRGTWSQVDSTAVEEQPKADKYCFKWSLFVIRWTDSNGFYICTQCR